MKHLTMIIGAIVVNSSAYAGEIEDQAAYDDWEDMFYHRTFVEQAVGRCPLLYVAGLISSTVKTPADWTPNDKRYQIKSSFKDKGKERALKDAQKLFDSASAGIHCARILENYGPNGKLYNDYVVRMPDLPAEQLHVTLGGFKSSMTMDEARTVFGREPNCRYLNEKYLISCTFEKGGINFGAPTEGEWIRALFSRDGRLFELRQTMDYPPGVTRVDAEAQALKKFRRFGIPHPTRISGTFWKLSKGKALQVDFFKRRMAIIWSDEDLRSANFDSLYAEKARD